MFLAAILLILAHVKRLEKWVRKLNARLDDSCLDELDLKPLDEGMGNLAKFEEKLNDRSFRRALVSIEFYFVFTIKKKNFSST